MLDSHVHGLNWGGALHRRGGQMVTVAVPVLDGGMTEPSRIRLESL